MTGTIGARSSGLLADGRQTTIEVGWHSDVIS